MNAMNTYYDRPDLPMGAPKTRGVNLGCFQHWPDSIIARYPHRIQSTVELPDAVKSYREILNQQPDSSVTIITRFRRCRFAAIEPDNISSHWPELVSKSKAARFHGGSISGRKGIQPSNRFGRFFLCL
jgi:hypothetical protein